MFYGSEGQWRRRFAVSSPISTLHLTDGRSVVEFSLCSCLRVLITPVRSLFRHFQCFQFAWRPGGKASAGAMLSSLRTHSEGFVQCGHFSNKRDSSDADVRTFWSKKLWIFRNLWCIRRGVEPVRTFFGQGGSIFRDFVRTSFMDELQLQDDWL